MNIVARLILDIAFLSGLTYAIAATAYILWRYLKRAWHGDKEAQWLGRHITAIAFAHLLSMGWIAARFMVYGHIWSRWWVIVFGAIIALSDFGIWQMYKYRRWRDRHAAAQQKGSE